MTETNVNRPAAGDCLLEVNNLVKWFPIKSSVFKRTIGNVKAVDGVSFKIKRGQTMGLVGESGCGKSTCGRTILRLQEKTSGQVLLGGQDIFALNKEELRKLLEKLFTMSALPEFVLQEALLEELEDEAGQSDGKEEGFSFEWIGEEKLLFEEKETLADRRGEEARSDDGREKAARRKREGPPTGRIFFAAALFLLGGLCLEYFRLYHPSLEAAQLPAKGVALAMLLFSALLSLAAVGLLFLGERHRQKDEEQERTARKREELRPTYEYA